MRTPVLAGVLLAGLSGVLAQTGGAPQLSQACSGDLAPVLGAVSSCGLSLTDANGAANTTLSATQITCICSAQNQAALAKFATDCADSIKPLLASLNVTVNFGDLTSEFTSACKAASNASTAAPGVSSAPVATASKPSTAVTASAMTALVGVAALVAAFL
ncbi:hypothetical protein BC830DRAFT_1154276 [Chytriomyces sp. MP71]|nr:hypothetical protein BC830DRAFT_1157579 [Chytriomyces sp. MP71]KAI8608685.1 hypothetical protein BC830DRAFT_1154276 [Chytriomyces sp. MP71]